MGSEPTVNPRDEARVAVDAAREIVHHRKGELIDEIRRYRVPDLPEPVGWRMHRLDAAEKDLEKVRTGLASLPPVSLDGPEADERTLRTRVSALVAANVVGLKLAASDRPFYPWAIRAPKGHDRLIDVPNYAGDSSAIAAAEKCLRTDELRHLYGAAPAQVVGLIPGKRTRVAVSTYRLATATPFERCCALLMAVGIDPDSTPPIAGT